MHYKLDKHNNVVPCTLEEYVAQYDNKIGNPRRVAIDDVEVGEELVMVSTVFLALDHGLEEGEHLFFETMVFLGDDYGDDLFCDRYETWDEAVEGHAKAVEKVRRMDGSI